MLGVPGLFDAYRAGNVTLVNAPGTGIADDKAVYTYVPEIIEFYLGEKALLKNVPTYNCTDDDAARLCARAHRRAGGEGSARLGRLRHAGRAGLDQGAAARSSGRRSSRGRTTTSSSRRWRSPPARPSSTAGIAPRHVDLRPYVLVGDQIRITPGGLTRVALKEGSLVVNSSQGGGTKDTWVLEE